MTRTIISGTRRRYPIVDINNVIAINAVTPLAIPTYDNSGIVVHPSVLYFPDKWNGYEYWMAMTPYTGTDSAYENPSILCSSDGQTWIVPAGVTNPLEPAPTPEYNHDPVIFMDADGVTMHYVYGQTGGATEIVYFKSSTDGVNWSDKVSILETTAEIERPVSPAILWDGTQYVMWYIDIVATPNVFRKRTCATLTGTWSNSSDCTIVCPVGLEWWHVDIKKYDNQYIGIMSFTPFIELRLISSIDGDTWNVSSTTIMHLADITSWWDSAFYKSTGILQYIDNEWKLAMWYGGAITNVWGVGYTEASLKKNKLQAEIDAVMPNAKGKVSPYLAGDDFVRADNAESLGDASSGQTWSALIGAAGIASNQLYLPTATNTKVVIDVGEADFVVEVEMTKYNAQCWLMFRCTDAANYYRFGWYGSIQLQKIQAGLAETTTLTPIKAIAHGDRWRVTTKGNSITCEVISNNGLTDYVKATATITNAFNATATKVGINCDNTTARFKNLWVKSN